MQWLCSVDPLHVATLMTRSPPPSLQLEHVCDLPCSSTRMRTGSCTWPTVERTVWAELKRDYELVPLTLQCVCVCPPITCTMCTAYTDKSCYNIFSVYICPCIIFMACVNMLLSWLHHYGNLRLWLITEEVWQPRVKGNVLHTHSLGVKVQYNVERVCGWHADVVPPLDWSCIIRFASTWQQGLSLLLKLSQLSECLFYKSQLQIAHTKIEIHSTKISKKSLKNYL